MPTCPHCNAELPTETLVAGGEVLACPHCQQPIDLTEEDWDLSSLAGGSPADATMQLGPASDSSLGGSSLADSEGFSDEFPSADASSDMTIDSAGAAASDEQSDTDFDATFVFGDRPEHADGDLEDDEDSDGGFLIEDEPEGPSESLDATIDFGRQRPSAGGDRDEATLGAEGLAGLGAAGDLTRMLDDSPTDSDAGELTTDSAQPSEPGGDSPTDATLPVDSDRPKGGSGSSVFSDSSLERTESPSSSADEATLQFDSDFRSGEVDTPEAIDITGLGSEDTMPRGPLDGGRASASLKPGESMLVGDESVRLRAFEISETDPSGARGIDYAIEGEAGKGGMGIVYKARQQSLDRLVAIKQIKSDMGASESDRNKFVSEAVITGQLEHPNIAPVHDLGLAADGLPFYAMKFVEGEDWEDSIKEKTEEENLAILIQVAQAIAFAHSKDVLHRDLKPGNVRLGSFGEVLVMDWGLAARLNDGSEIQPAGTPIYMPPETALEYLDYAKGKVVAGRRVGSSRRRVPAGTYCDIYLLGALLFKIVTGRAPHRGKTTFECLRAAAKNDIVKVRRSSELLDIAYKAMATEPEDRYANALEFIEAIRAYQSHAQSILIAKRASKDLRQAGRLVDAGKADPTELYALFSGAQNGYQNALELWEGNRKASRRLRKTKRMFAETAYANGDYDLALSLIDEAESEDVQLKASVVASQKSRNARVTWFRTLQYATAASLVLALAFIGYSVVAKLDAISANAEAAKAISDKQTAKAEADLAIQQAAKAKQDALDAEARADQATKLATAKEEKATKAEQAAAIATTQAAEAREAESKALLSASAAETKANRAVEQARLESFKAALGEVRATLADSGRYAAWKVMRRVDPAIVAIGAETPEWRYLVKAVDWQAEATELVPEGPPQAKRPTVTATSTNGKWLVSAANVGGGTELAIYTSERDVPEQTLRVAGESSDLGIDASGRYVALLGERLRVIDRSSGDVLNSDQPIQAATCFAFHPARSELLVGKGTTAIERWLIDDRSLVRQERDDRWHQRSITSVGYSPDGEQRFSTDSTGRVVLWRARGGEWGDRTTAQHIGTGSPRITAAVMADNAEGRLAYGCDDGSVYEITDWWKGPSRVAEEDGGYAQITSQRLTQSHAGAVTDICYDALGTTILSAGGDTLLTRRSPFLAAEVVTSLTSIRTERRYHDAAVLSCASGPDGQAYSSDRRGRLLRWRVEAAPAEATLQPREAAVGVAAVRFSAEGSRLDVADQSGFVRTWDDIAHVDAYRTAYAGHADHRELRAWYVGGSPELAVTVAADNRACVWRLDDGLLQRSIDLGGRTIVAVDPTRGTLYAASDGRPVDGPSAAAWKLTTGLRSRLWDDASRVAKILPLPDDDLALAIGLRDGQVALWRASAGRLELVRSSSRPHWRSISALAYDQERQRLYSGDTGGLVARWDLAGNARPVERLIHSGDDSARNAIEQLGITAEGRLLVVQKATEGVVPRLLNSSLQTIDAGRLATDGLLDTTTSPSNGRLQGLRGVDGKRELVTWDEQAGWQPTGQVSPSTMNQIQTTPAGLLAWGGGQLQWLPNDPDERGRVTKIVSRPKASALLDSSKGAVQAITETGSIDQIDNGRKVVQRSLPLDGRLLASCWTDVANQAVLAIAKGADGCRIELWDTSANKRLRLLANVQAGVHKLVHDGQMLLGLGQGQVLVVASGGDRGPQRVSVARLPAASGTPVDAAFDEKRGRLAIATAGGTAWLAEQDAAGQWKPRRLDQTGISSVAFTPDGKRLLAGVRSGRVLMLDIGQPVDGVLSTRSVLSLPGHSDRVTLLEVAGTADGLRLVSGDASGRVVMRSL